MADVEPVELETVESVEGQVVVDITAVPDNEREMTRERLVRFFSPVTLRVKNAQGELMPYGVEVVQCKVCGSLLQRLVGPLMMHARSHERAVRRRGRRVA